MRAKTPHHQKWLETIPSSEMVYPDEWRHRIKYYLWRIYTPYHPYVRDAALSVRFVKQRGRQPYLLGKIRPDLSIEEFVEFLVEHGYAYHRVAWEDDGEVVSLRHVETFSHQYHVRIFEDGEVRGHYEYTPECYPFYHLWEVARADRRDRFLQLVGDRLIPHTSADQSDHEWEFLGWTQRPLS